MSHNHHTKNTCPTCNEVVTCKCSAKKVNTQEVCNKCNDKVVNEDAAAGSTGAASVATVNTPLKGGMIRRQRNVVANIPIIRYKNKVVSKPQKRKLTEMSSTSFSAFLKESADAEDKFDSVDVISKLANNTKISDKLDGDQLAVFGLEDGDGGITKVYVPAESGKEFEQALGDALRHTKENGQTEIAALLFDLKDKFSIIDVKWPEVQEDEEQVDSTGGTNAVAPIDPNAVDPNAVAPVDPNAVPAATGDVSEMPPGGAADGADMGISSEVNPSDILTQILDMMKADAAARKAEANAKEADAAARVAATKIQGEESTLDAEAYFKARKEEKKEADRLKMLARYRQETQQSSQSPREDRSEEEEQITNTRKHLLNILNGMR